MAGNPDPPVVSSGPLGWNGLIAERYRHAPAEHHFPPLPEDTASLYLGEPVRSVRWSEDRIHEGPTSRGDVTVKASGQPVGWHFDRDVDLLVMRFEPAFLVRVAEENGLDPDAARLRPSFDGRDEAVKHIGRAMLAEIEDGGPGGRVYGDALATALATHLLRSHGAAPRPAGDQKGGLSGRALRRVRDFVGDNLSRDIGLAEMAGVANLSRYHFSRQFKCATGLSPHQYVIGRRVERARELLQKTDLAVGDVASAVGFSHQSHLARYVRRRFGVAPSALRR
jgi:AraC family transcriptional regulator